MARFEYKYSEVQQLLLTCRSNTQVIDLCKVFNQVIRLGVKLDRLRVARMAARRIERIENGLI